MEVDVNTRKNIENDILCRAWREGALNNKWLDNWIEKEYAVEPNKEEAGEETDFSRDNWISILHDEPSDQQLVIIDNGQPISLPAKYNKERKEFERFPNTAVGDRASMYHYTDVAYWMPFPEIKTCKK